VPHKLVVLILHTSHPTQGRTSPVAHDVGDVAQGFDKDRAPSSLPPACRIRFLKRTPKFIWRDAFRMFKKRGFRKMLCTTTTVRSCGLLGFLKETRKPRKDCSTPRAQNGPDGNRTMCSSRLASPAAITGTGLFSKKNRIVPLWSFCKQQSKTTKARPNEPAGGRAFFFLGLRYYYYVNVTFSSTLRYRAGAAFSFSLRYRSGREAHRGSR
jgi:hypothetical protein